MPAKKRSDCRYCGSEDLSLFLSLGDQPPSNGFLRPDQIDAEQRYPLDVYLCQNCSLVQLIDVVPAESIFDEYLYLSSSSKALKEHYARLANAITTTFALQAGDVVVDIGCNDGILLHGYPSIELQRVGVEPSRVAELAAQSGLRVFNTFFGAEVAQQVTDELGPAKVVTATNVFAHVDDIAGFVDGIPKLLASDGVFIIEAPYLVNLIEETLFDTIYHEHLCYLSLTPMVPFLGRFGLEVFRVERVPFGASGPAFRTFVQHKGGPHKLDGSDQQMLSDELSWGIGKQDRYVDYAQHVASLKDQILTLLYELQSKGARMGGYGAPAKGNTLLNYLGLTGETVEVIAETNELKQGTLAPGSHIPIVSEEEFLRRMPDYALLLSWNYLDFFLEKSEYIRGGGKFVVPLPTPRIEPE